MGKRIKKKRIKTKAKKEDGDFPSLFKTTSLYDFFTLDVFMESFVGKLVPGL
jgi:hypothetical protein